MKVMCIKSEKWTYDFTGDESKEKDPVYGEICIVLEVQKFSNGQYYVLKGYEHTSGYNSKHFIPISDIDETELVKERELVC